MKLGIVASRAKATNPEKCCNSKQNQGFQQIGSFGEYPVSSRISLYEFTKMA